MGNMGKFHISHVKFIWEAVLEKFLHIEKWINKNFSGYFINGNTLFLSEKRYRYYLKTEKKIIERRKT